MKKIKVNVEDYDLLQEALNWLLLFYDERTKSNKFSKEDKEFYEEKINRIVELTDRLTFEYDL